MQRIKVKAVPIGATTRIIYARESESSLNVVVWPAKPREPEMISQKVVDAVLEATAVNQFRELWMKSSWPATLSNPHGR